MHFIPGYPKYLKKEIDYDQSAKLFPVHLPPLSISFIITTTVIGPWNNSVQIVKHDTYES